MVESGKKGESRPSRGSNPTLWAHEHRGYKLASQADNAAAARWEHQTQPKMSARAGAVNQTGPPVRVGKKSQHVFLCYR